MNKLYPWKQAVITGIVVSISAIVIFSIADGVNRHQHWNINPITLRGLTGLLSIVILAIGIYTGMKSVKRNNGGKLTYGQAIFAGLIIGLITGIISALVGFTYVHFINPGYAAYMISESRKIMLADGKGPAQIAAGTADLQKQMTTGMQALQALIGQTVSGTILSLIIGVFVKSKK